MGKLTEIGGNLAEFGHCRPKSGQCHLNLFKLDQHQAQFGRTWPEKERSRLGFWTMFCSSGADPSRVADAQPHLPPLRRAKRPPPACFRVKGSRASVKWPARHGLWGITNYPCADLGENWPSSALKIRHSEISARSRGTLGAQSVMTWGRVPRIWTKLGPTGMERRDGSSGGARGPPRPLKSDSSESPEHRQTRTSGAWIVMKREKLVQPVWPIPVGPMSPTSSPSKPRTREFGDAPGSVGFEGPRGAY